MSANAATPPAPTAPTAALTTWALHHFSKLPADIQRAVSQDLRTVRKSQDGIVRAQRAIAADLRAHRSTGADRAALGRAEKSLSAGVAAFHVDGARAAKALFTPKTATTTPAPWAMNHFSKLSPATRATLGADLRDVRKSEDGIARARAHISADLQANVSTAADRLALQSAENGLAAGLATLHADATQAGVNYAN